MERRRDRNEIVAKILNIAIDGKVKTHIMYKAKLSYTQVNKYLPWLEEKGFLENMKSAKVGQFTTIYKTTPKGLKLIERLKFIDKLWAKDKTSSEPSEFSVI
jgi:predicted transcriptional regulator